MRTGRVADEMSRWRRQKVDARMDRSLANIERMIQQNSLAMTSHLEYLAREAKALDASEQPVPNPTTALVRRNHQRQGKQSVVHIRLPKWLTGKLWRFAADHAETGWDWSLHTLRMVPPDSLIFRACRSGDVELVRHLLSSGEASVHDTTTDLNGRFRTPILVRVSFPSYVIDC